MFVWVRHSSSISCLSIRFPIFSASTAFHAIELGFRTILIDDCSRGIDEKSIETAYEKVRNGWGLVVQSREVK